MAARSGRFHRADRLRDSRDFRRVAGGGKRATSPHFILLVALARDPRRVRLGVTVSRKVGGAVVRNRVKRRIREWFRGARPTVDPCDLVVIARPSAAGLTASALASDLTGLLAHALGTRRRG